jgi:hypothetical protein
MRLIAIRLKQLDALGGSLTRHQEGNSKFLKVDPFASHRQKQIFIMLHEFAARGLQPTDDDFRNALHQFVAEVVILLA